MTDVEAKNQLQRGLVHGPDGVCRTCDAIRHALRAIDDRAALVGAVDAAAVTGSVQKQYDDSKRHMEGQ